ncbi:hypothetical protein ACO2FA_13430 [Staphylococcus warneri]
MEELLLICSKRLPVVKCLAAWNMLVSKIQEIARQFSEKESNDTGILMGEDIDEIFSYSYSLLKNFGRMIPRDIRFSQPLSF